MKRKRRDYIACPHCSHGVSEVLRTTPLDGIGWRLRQCHGCKRSFTTTETSDLAAYRTIYTGITKSALPTCINK